MEERPEINNLLDNILHVNIYLEKESTFSGSVTLYINTGGVRGVKVDNRSLKFYKADSIKPKILDSLHRSV